MDLRLFIAIELPESWTGALAEIQAALRRRGLANLRWTRPEGIHLTLKFLGNVDEQRVPEIITAMSAAATAAPRFTLRLDRLGSFGATTRPRVVWAGVTGDLTSLTRLWQAVEARMAPLGFPTERDRLAPHLTLARVPDHLQREAAGPLAQAIGGAALPRTEPLRVQEIALMRSELGRGGARYMRLAATLLIEKS